MTVKQTQDLNEINKESKENNENKELFDIYSKNKSLKVKNKYISHERFLKNIQKLREKGDKEYSILLRLFYYGFIDKYQDLTEIRLKKRPSDQSYLLITKKGMWKPSIAYAGFIDNDFFDDLYSIEDLTQLKKYKRRYNVEKVDYIMIGSFNFYLYLSNNRLVRIRQKTEKSKRRWNVYCPIDSIENMYNDLNEICPDMTIEKMADYLGSYHFLLMHYDVKRI